MTEPTEEQIKRFWERCGLKLLYPPNYPDGYHLPQWEYKDENVGDLPIDLNNLFKYVVPKVQKEYDTMWFGTLLEWLEELHMDTTLDPALALFWAIYKAWGLE